MPRANLLFVCIENAGRSQMAEAFAKRLGAEHVEAWSAGSKPSGRLNPVAVEVMKERGIDMSAQRSKALSDLPAQRWDYVVTMGCGDACPFVPAKARIDLNVPDPKGKTKDEVDRIASLIEQEVVVVIKRAIRDGFSR